MENQIHPTAILEGHIRMGTGNVIGPHVVMRGDLDIGDENYFGTGVCLENKVRIGHKNQLYPYVCLGALGEMGAKGDRLKEDGMVRIGNEVTLREFVVIHSPVYHDATVVEDHVYLMNNCYVAHDGHIGEHTVMSAGVSLGGRVTIGHHVNVGMGAVVHQQRVIGQGAIVGMGSVVNRDILPYAKVAGNPVRILGFNLRAAENISFDPVWLDEMTYFFENPIDPEDETPNPVKREIFEFLKRHPESLLKVKSFR